MTTVRLPTLPNAKEFEELLAAYFQASGQFIERNVVDRQQEEVLELDFIATNYRAHSSPDVRLFEVKSGAWGFADVFKIAGWLRYLNLSEGALLVSQCSRPLAFAQSIGSKIDVKIAWVESLTTLDNHLGEFIGTTETIAPDIPAWRYSFWLERIVIERLRQRRKSHKDISSYSMIFDYFDHINNKSFFEPNSITRASSLYDSYFGFKNLSARLAAELDGNNPSLATSIPSRLFSKTYYNCEETDLMLSSFVEHRGRLAVIKSVVDYICHRNAGQDHNSDFDLKAGDRSWNWTLMDSMPSSFNAAVEEIQAHKYFYRYPTFWQHFLWLFGGFIVSDRLEEEYGLLSLRTGIPIDEISNALKIYDVLFPIEKGWFVKSGGGALEVLRLFCPPFLGMGAIYRGWHYGKKNRVLEVVPNNQYATQDLTKWNNLAVSLLAKNS